MKTFIHALFFFFGVILFSSCALPSMIKMSKDQNFSVNPTPLEVHNGLVEYKMKVDLPVKMLKKGTVYTLNSFYRYGDKELPMDPISFKVEDYPNSNVDQPTVSKSFSFPYQPMYEKGVLEIEGVASKGTKTKTTPRLEVANGLITTPMLVQDSYYVTYATHGYNNQEEIIPLVIPDFIFKQGKSILLKSELVADKGKKLNAFIASKNVTKSVTIIGTHSPEGTEKVNERLSQERASAIEKYYRKKMSQYDYQDKAKSIQFNLKPVVENWDAFKNAFSSYDGISSHEKSAYLKIISNGNTFDNQEKEMKKIPSYKKVFKDIYPALRVAKTKIITVKQKKTDAEISTLAKQIVEKKTNAELLSFEEIMYAASLTPSLQEKEAIYKIATKKGTHASAHNNLGAVYLSMIISNPPSKFEIIKKASVQLDLALKIEEIPEINANLATVSMMYKQPKKALEYATKALYRSNDEVSQGVNGVKSAAEIYLAKYDKAVQSASIATPTRDNLFNQGLANLLTKNYKDAASSLESAIKKDAEFAKAYYVMAIVNAKTDNEAGVISNLTKAFKLDPNLKKKALIDLEFRKWSTLDSFMTIMK